MIQWIVLSVVLAVAVASCSDFRETLSGQIEFLVRLDSDITKASLINNEDAFIEGVGSFNVMMRNSLINDNDIVSYSSEKWISSKEHFLTLREDIDFFCVAPSGHLNELDAVADYQSHELSFLYNSVGKSYSDEDLLCGYYRGPGNNGCAQILFSHPLCAIVLKMGSIDSGFFIKNVGFSGVAIAGSCTIKFNNSDGSSLSVTWSQTDSGLLDISNINANPANNENISEPIMMIPQTFSNTSTALFLMTISVSGQDRTLTYNLSGTNWEPGKVYSYTVDVTEDSISFNDNVVNWNQKGENWPVY